MDRVALILRALGCIDARSGCTAQRDDDRCRNQGGTGDDQSALHQLAIRSTLLIWHVTPSLGPVKGPLASGTACWPALTFSANPSAVPTCVPCASANSTVTM